MLNFFQDIIYLNGGTETLQSKGLFPKFASVACSNVITKVLCMKVYSAIFGPSPTETNTTLISIAVRNVIGGGSSKPFVHFIQGINSGIYIIAL